MDSPASRAFLLAEWNLRLYVPPELTGVLLGRGGENINALCRETGARIEVAREDAGNADARSMI